MSDLVLPEDVEIHGNWMEVNRVISRMYKDRKTGVIYYDDNKETRARGLPLLSGLIGFTDEGVSLCPPMGDNTNPKDPERS